MDNSMDNIDISWSDEFFRATEGGQTYEPELMNNISLKVIYTNKDNEIFHTIDKDIPLEIRDNNSILSEEYLIETIHKYKDFNNKRFKCDSIVKYFISMDPQIVIENINNKDFVFNPDDCFSQFEIPKTISFPTSLFIFHSINAVYILFREMVLVDAKKLPVSIIKKYKNKITKRVRIADDLPSYTSNMNNRKTRKR
jgi:hypothetical protein